MRLATRLTVALITLAMLTVERTAARVPSADEIINRFVRTVAPPGTPAVTSRVMKGTVDSEATRRILGQAVSVSVTVIEKPPNRWVTTWTPTGPSAYREGFDGSVGWAKVRPPATASGFRRLTTVEVAQKTRDADVSKGTRLRELYRSFAKVSAVTIDGQPADVIAAVPAEGGAAEQLYFDRATGLLIQKDAVRSFWALADDLFEDVAFVYQFADYRRVDGWMLPFRIQVDAPLFGYVMTLTEIRHNMPIDDAQFAPPAEMGRR